jgi:hypothetical protein
MTRGVGLVREVAGLLLVGALVAGVAGCRDLSRFSTGSGKYEGTIATGAFVRSGFVDSTRVCMTLDTDHLQDAPGVISTDDGRFKAAPLRPIPELFHDPLSTLNFGEGRVKNFVYVARPSGDPKDTSDVTVVVSLLQSSDIEVRMFRSAPSQDGADGGAEPAARLFGVFALSKGDGACSF